MKCDFCGSKEKLFKCGYGRKLIMVYLCRKCIEKEKSKIREV